FFCVSVATTLALSPTRWASAKSPRSELDTFRSLIWWRSPSRVTRTRRTSALPYWLSPKVMAMTYSREMDLVMRNAVFSIWIALVGFYREHGRSPPSLGVTAKPAGHTGGPNRRSRTQPELRAQGRRQLPGHRPAGPDRLGHPAHLVRPQPRGLPQAGQLRLGQQAQEPLGQPGSGRGCGAAEDPEPGHAAVGIDVEPHRAGHRLAGDGEAVPGIRLQRRPGQQVTTVSPQRRPARRVAHEV